MTAGLRSIAARISIGFVFLLVLLHVTPLVPWAANWFTGEWGEPKGDILIVLSADQLGDGTLGMVSYWRSVYAVRAYRSGGFRQIVVSGGKLGYPQAPSVSSSMAEFMTALGVPREAITLEERSTSTRENALFTAALIRDWPGKKVLLTSDCHMRRARRAFARAGVETSPAPMPDIGKRWNHWVDRWASIAAVAGEAGKFVYYELRGWI